MQTTWYSLTARALPYRELTLSETMTKFPTRDDRGYRTVLGSLRRAMREVQKAAERPAGNEKTSQSDAIAEDSLRGQISRSVCGGLRIALKSDYVS